MKPIIFARVASMKYYRGITETDTPYGAGSYVTETGDAHECYNFKAEPEIFEDDDNEYCLGFVMQNGSAGIDAEIHLEKMQGCSQMKKQEAIDGVTVVFCAQAVNSDTMRVVGFYKNATVYRKAQKMDFFTNEGGVYEQTFQFIAKKDDCVLLPFHERHAKNKWYVPKSGVRGASFGFGRSNIWFANSNNEKLVDYVNRMIKSIDEYDGENWMDKEV